MSPLVYCRDCATVARPRKDTPGSFLLEVVLWLCFLVPGFIYSVWRLTSKRRVCTTCGSRAIIPADAPAAVQTLAQQGRTSASAAVMSAERAGREDSVMGWSVLLAGIALIVTAVQPADALLAVLAVGWAAWNFTTGRALPRFGIALAAGVALPIAAGLVGGLFR